MGNNLVCFISICISSVIENVKHHHRRQLLGKLLVEDEDVVLANHKKINLSDCAYMVAKAWSLVKVVALRHVWNKLKGIPTEEEKEKEKKEKEVPKKKEDTGEDGNDVSLKEFRNILLKIPGCSEVSAEDTDLSDPGYEILYYDELIESVREESCEQENGLNVKVEAYTGPSASQAFSGHENALKWRERQHDHTQLLTVQRMHDLAVRKQLTLKDMFSKQ